MSEKEVNVILVGAKSIGQYGGYESFINKLLEYHKDEENLHYYVYCKANGSGCMDIGKLPGAKAVNETEFIYCNARGFLLQVPQIGAAQAIYYDVKALSEACKLRTAEKSDCLYYGMPYRSVYESLRKKDTCTWWKSVPESGWT